ncbi:NIPSNAP family protein [Metapseudomonas furukawaii]|uniref:NIPSNAP family protein n=1 Tax=Metapseudomonas furukawaii TaxID=1149133 RepID=UPI00227A3A83|nr:NIPSNAP family protein [Pseudomonas furukawaii]WAG81573.1 NIPSNAP family protein [Pseudomonas furukawaii]
MHGSYDNNSFGAINRRIEQVLTGGTMLVEQRTYTLQPGKTHEYLALYEAEALPIQRRILGRLVGYYRSEIGALNQVVHLWAFTDLLEREQRRAVMQADPGFKAYVQKMLPLLISQESRILAPAPFFTPTWQE